jgi:hypothetical protein
MSARAAELAAPRSLPAAAKLRLAAEILGAYRRVRRTMRGRSDITEALRVLRNGAPAGPAPTGDEAKATGIRLGRAVSRTLRVVPVDSRCLTQSLVLTTLLSRRGLGSALIIAVNPDEEFGAHAWVELEGCPLLPTGGGEYARLVEL